MYATHLRPLLTCPHFVIRGALGGDKHIGHVVKPSSLLSRSELADVDASADDRGMITWRISCHWKNLAKAVNHGPHR